MEVLPDKIHVNISVLVEDGLEMYLECFHGVFCSLGSSVPPRHWQADSLSLRGATNLPEELMNLLDVTGISHTLELICPSIPPRVM